jgi:4-hydroxybutyrate CoA-transferase
LATVQPVVEADPAQAAAILLRNRPRATILSAMAPQQPDTLLRALVRHAGAHGIQLRILAADVSGAYAFLRDEDAVELDVLAGPVPRTRPGGVGYYPDSLWQLDRRIADGTIPFDVFVARVHGDLSEHTLALGCMVGWTPSALRNDASVGFELVPRVEDMPASDAIAVPRGAVLVPLPASQRTVRKPRPPSAMAIEIAEHVASCIPAGATIQLGLGAVPDALAARLSDIPRIRLHSGILPPGAMDLTAAGIPAVATGVVGETGWGPTVRLEPIAETHHPRRLAGLDRLWAINSAFEIDLTGAVNAEYVDGARVATAGGQIDFLRAAHGSHEGASVLALPSRSRDGRSRIVGRIRDDHAAAVRWSDLDLVITEYGTASLTGATLAERVERLVGIAHPDDRAELRAFMTRSRSSLRSPAPLA